MFPVLSVLDGTEWQHSGVGSTASDQEDILTDSQPVGSVSTWECDSLPEWDVSQDPIAFLTTPSVLPSNTHWSFQQLCKKSSQEADVCLKQGWMYLPRMSQQVGERARTRTLPFRFQSGCFLTGQLVVFFLGSY